MTPEKKNAQKPKSSAPSFLREVKGMHDRLPQDEAWWEWVEKHLKDLAAFYGFARIETPAVEHAELFEKTAGETSDLVQQKEMYVLKTAGGDALALRPEYTAGVVRAYLNHSLSRLGQPQKLFSLGPVFRHDNPQQGRYRQFTQANFEILGGTNDPLYDAQVVILIQRILEGLKMKEIVLKVNSIGCKVCRPVYKKQLQAYYKNHERDLCKSCLARLQSNPLRLLDCKDSSCQKLKEGAPDILDKLCAACSAHLRSVLEYLDELKIPYELDNRLVRGLDYYSKTVFEFSAGGAGKEVGAVAGGGRYDYLMEMIGKHASPAVGGSVGLERLKLALEAQGALPPARNQKKVFVAHAGELAKKKCVKLIESLRVMGFRVSESLAKESLGAQLKSADREGALLALILGQKEMYEGSVIVRDLRSGVQETVSLEKVQDELKKRLK